ncbi:uracil-DNA glycosylase family protein [Leptospira sp. WS92.C1]
MSNLKTVLQNARACTICKENLPFAPNPILRANVKARILLIGQAPGLKVNSSGVPWQDVSGDRLREWMGIDSDMFYNEEKIAIIPMGFCYPGKGKSGDLPPRPECAPEWHPKLLSLLPNIQLTILIGQYAQERYLQTNRKETLSATVQAFKKYNPYFPIVHPSPRNQIWLKKNPWFLKELVPYLRKQVARIL